MVGRKIRKSEKTQMDKTFIAYEFERESIKREKGADEFVCLPGRHYKWCEALVVFQPINPLHIFNPVRCAAGEEH